jgi:hypothetical protein
MTIYAVTPPTGAIVNFRFKINNVVIDGCNLAAGSQTVACGWAYGVYNFVTSDLLAVACQPRVGYNQDMSNVGVIISVEVVAT